MYWYFCLYGWKVFLFFVLKSFWCFCYIIFIPNLHFFLFSGFWLKCLHLYVDIIVGWLSISFSASEMRTTLCWVLVFSSYFLFSIWIMVKYDFFSSFALGNPRLQTSKGWMALLQTIRCLRLKFSIFLYLEGTLHLHVYQMAPVLQGMFISIELSHWWKALDMRS